jgi:purine-nucleoside phosphorylase
MPCSSVAGHEGNVHLGRLGGVPVLVQEGRVHRYEGWTARVVARSVRCYARLGIRGFVLCNAAGGLRRDWPPGTLMRISDQINLQGGTPLAHAEARRGNPYDPAFGAVLERAARSAGVRIERGTYAGLLGPSYETAAEVRLLRSIGADAVGMSTVAEALAAAAAGGRVVGLSLITNHAAGLAQGPLTHDDVLAAGKAAASAVSGLLQAAVEPLSSAL